MTRKPAKRTRMPQRVMARSMQPSNWSLKSYLQWLPVFSVAVSGIVMFTRVLDRLDALEKSAPTTSIAEELTHQRDRIDTDERDINKLENKEATDVAELKNGQQQIWQYVGHIHGVPPP